MPVRKISFREFLGGLWVKGPVENTPVDSLRRATSVYPVRGGSLRSRSGGVAYFAVDAHSLYAKPGAQFVGTTTTLKVGNGPGALFNISGMPVLTGARLSFLEIPVQFLSTNPNQNASLGIPETDFLFASDGATPFKVDGSLNASFWGIAAPAAAVVTGGGPFAGLVAAPLAPASKAISNFSTAGDFFTAGASGFGSAIDTVRTVDTSAPIGSLRLSAPKDSETVATAAFASDLTAFTTPGDSTDEDYIQFYVQVARPTHCKSINLKFFVGPGPFDKTKFTDPNADDPSAPAQPYTHYYSVELSVQLVKKKRKKQLVALGDFLPDNKHEVRKFLRDHPKGVAPDLDMQQFLNDLTIEVARNTWTKVTVPKGLFSHAGLAGQAGTAGVDDYTWASVIGFQAGVESNTDGRCHAWFDAMTMMGGTGTRGDYLYTITYLNDNTGSRSNPPTTTDARGNTIILTAKGQQSATAPLATSVTLDRQACHLTGFPAALVAAAFDDARADPQVTHLELWRTIGNGVPGKPNAPFLSPSTITFFRVDKIAVGVTTYDDHRGDYPGMHALDSATFLDPNQELTFDNAPPPRTLTQAVVHPSSGRVFALDSANPGRVLYSAPGRPESLGSVGFVEPTIPGDPIQRLAVWNDLVYVFSQDHLYQIQGNDEPFVVTTVAGAPGCYIYPFSVVAAPVGIFYVSQYGPRLFDGAVSRAIADDGLAPIFRGSATDGLSAFGAFGSPIGPIAAWARGEYLLSDVTHTTLAYSVDHDCWRNLGLPANALAYAPAIDVLLASTVAAGAGSRSVNALEGSTIAPGASLGGIVGETTTDAGATLSTPFEVETPAVFVGGENVANVQMVYVEADTQNQLLTVTLLLDGVAFVLGTLTVLGKTRSEFNVNLPGNIASLRLRTEAAAITKRMEVSSLEIQVYEPSGEG